MEENKELEMNKTACDQPKEKATFRDHMYGRIDVQLSSIDRFIKILLALLVISVIIGILI